jgi:hypothetical protein
VEVHPISGLLIGARINVSFGDLYSTDPADYANGMPPSFIPKVDVKNNVPTFLWVLGKQPATKKEKKKIHNPKILQL